MFTAYRISNSVGVVLKSEFRFLVVCVAICSRWTKFATYRSFNPFIINFIENEEDVNEEAEDEIKQRR